MTHADHGRHAQPDEEFVYPPPHPRRPMVLGLIGAVGGVCCWPLGLLLGGLSIARARRHGGTYLWGLLAVVASILNLAVAIVYYYVLRST